MRLGRVWSVRGLVVFLLLEGREEKRRKKEEDGEGGNAREEGGRRWGYCRLWFSATSYALHSRTCGRVGDAGSII